MFRSPNQRLISAYNFDKHLSLMGFASTFYFWNSSKKLVHAQTADKMEFSHGKKGRRIPMDIHWRDEVQKGARTPRAFAATAGVAGCLARMLSACSCASRPVPAEPGKI